MGVCFLYTPSRRTVPSHVHDASSIQCLRQGLISHTKSQEKRPLPTDEQTNSDHREQQGRALDRHTFVAFEIPSTAFCSSKTHSQAQGRHSCFQRYRPKGQSQWTTRQISTIMQTDARNRSSGGCLASEHPTRHNAQAQECRATRV